MIQLDQNGYGAVNGAIERINPQTNRLGVYNRLKAVYIEGCPSDTDASRCTHACGQLSLKLCAALETDTTSQNPADLGPDPVRPVRRETRTYLAY